MMMTFSTDKARFQQPSSVYSVGDDLYIKGSSDVPPKPKAVKPSSKPKKSKGNKGNKGKEKKNKKKH
jgi:penicillin-binding protein 1A